MKHVTFTVSVTLPDNVKEVRVWNALVKAIDVHCQDYNFTPMTFVKWDVSKAEDKKP